MVASRVSPGRPRAFHEDELFDRSIDLFWRNGLHGTTTRLLEQELEVSQSSLYNAYGSKEGLLDRVIERYEAQLDEAVLQKLRPPSREAIVAFIDAVVGWVSQDRHRGCLVLNLAGEDREHAHRLKVYRRRLRRALKPAIRTFTDDATVADQRTELLVAAVLGLNLSATTGAGRAELNRIAAGLREQVIAW